MPVWARCPVASSVPVISVLQRRGQAPSESVTLVVAVPMLWVLLLPI
jgi:hypothetical protein